MPRSRLAIPVREYPIISFKKFSTRSLRPNPLEKEREWDCRSCLGSSKISTGIFLWILLPRPEQHSSLRCRNTRYPPVKTLVPHLHAITPGSGHILFVDDEVPITHIVKEFLEHLGYTVTVRVNAVEALEAFRANPQQFDCLITDQTMPTLGGNQLAREILKIRPQYAHHSVHGV